MRLFVLFILWLAGTAAIFYGMCSNLPKLMVLSERGVETRGKVLDLSAIQSHAVRYSFQGNDGKEYSGKGWAGYGNPSFRDLSAGQTVMVFYDPKDPNLSVLGDPKKERNNELKGNILCVFGLTVVFVYILTRRLFI
jgi:hypothetical protein